MSKLDRRKFPLFLESVQAGFPSPADDHIEKMLDLNEYLIKHPNSTFFVRVTGDSMIDSGINTGDILIVDKSLEPKSGKIIIAALDGELTVKRFENIKNKTYLMPENKNYEPIEVTEENEFFVWGVVVNVIKFI